MEIKNMRFKDSEVDVEKRTFTGYASIFGNIDSYNDIVMPGAFSKTIQERGDRIKVMYNHMWAIGKATHLEEKDKGLYVEGYISKTQRGDDVLSLIKDGAIDELSIGYDPVKWEREQRDGIDIRLLKEIKLYEFSPVDFAANDQAVITGMKSIALLRGIELDDVQVQTIIKSLEQLKAEPETLGDPEDIQSLLAKIQATQKWAEHRLY